MDQNGRFELISLITLFFSVMDSISTFVGRSVKCAHVLFAIPYSSRVAFGLYEKFEDTEFNKLPSPIHHGLHSDRENCNP